MRSDLKIWWHIRKYAEEYVDRRFSSVPNMDRENLIFNSMSYIVEESGWTIYIAANRGVTDNFYPGNISVLLDSFYSSDLIDQYAKALGLGDHVHRVWDVSALEAGQLTKIPMVEYSVPPYSRSA